MSWRNPHRGRGGSRHVGRLRIKAAEILSKHFGWEVYPEEVQPQVGAWRTDNRLDVYRWELFTYSHRGSHPMPYIAGCWERLTDFVRVASKHGMHVVDDTIYSGQAPKKLVEIFEE